MGICATGSKDIKLVLKNIFILLAPLLIFYIASAFVLFASGELTSTDNVIRVQESSKNLVLYGQAYSQSHEYYKLKSVLKREPQIIAIGTSRALQIRSAFFKDVEFFNAAKVIRILRDYRPFLDAIPEGKEPEILIISLDQFFFKPHEDMNQTNFDSLTTNNNDWLQALTFGPPKLARRATDHLYSIATKKAVQFVSRSPNKKDVQSAASISAVTTSSILSSPADLMEGARKIGLNALVANNGYRNDGSYYTGSFIADPKGAEDYLFKTTLSKISRGVGVFEESNIITKKSLNELDLILEECDRRGIHVIAFLPPYAHEVYEELRQTGRHKYLFNLSSELIPIFKKHDAAFYDYSDLKTIGSSDEEVIDGWHASEKAYLRIIIKLSENDSLLGQYTDIEYLKKRLSKSKSPFFVFDNNEF